MTALVAFLASLALAEFALLVWLKHDRDWWIDAHDEAVVGWEGTCDALDDANTLAQKLAGFRDIDHAKATAARERN